MIGNYTAFVEVWGTPRKSDCEFSTKNIELPARTRAINWYRKRPINFFGGREPDDVSFGSSGQDSC
jgi:hypothetical protein